MSVSQQFGAAALGNHHVVLHRIAAFAELAPGDAEMISGLPLERRGFAPRAELGGGIAPGRPRFVLSGWACRQRLLPDGRRQIFDFVLPGDLVGSCFPSQVSIPVATVALTRVEALNAAPLQAVLAERDAAQDPFARACMALERQSEALLLNQVMRLGRQTAYERAAHLLLELHERLAAVGLAQGNRFPFPLRQEMLAEALGLSVVHVNRTLQQLRRDRMIELGNGYAMLLQPQRLRDAADYAPAALAVCPIIAINAVRSSPRPNGFSSRKTSWKGAGITARS